MKDLVDYIKYHGYITSIRANVDKKGHRQNYIHVLNINEIVVNKEPPLYGDEYWNGQKIPTDDEPLTEEDIKIQKELEEIINSFK